MTYDERSEGQIAADALEDRVSKALADIDELGDILAKATVLVERLVDLQELMDRRLASIEGGAA